MVKQMAHFDAQAEIQRLQAKLAETEAKLTVALTKPAAPLGLKINPKGTVTMTGVRNAQYAPTYWPSEWAKIAGHGPVILEFLKTHEADLKAKSEYWNSLSKTEQEQFMEVNRKR